MHMRVNDTEIISYLRQTICLLKRRLDKIVVNAGVFSELKKVQEQIKETEKRLQIEEACKNTF
jgi:predicted nucleic acid-binding protein